MTTNQNRGDAVKRYDMKERVRGMESWYVLEQDPDGDYVSFEDYSALQLRVTSLEGALKGMLAAFEGKFSFNEMAAFEQVACNEARAALSPSGPQEA